MPHGIPNHDTFNDVLNRLNPNEINTIAQWLALLGIQGATTDAMGCQFKIANQIVNAKADYVPALKGSQGECFDDVQFFSIHR